MNYETQENIDHFNWGHFGAIALCAIFLMSITIMKNGFHFTPVVSEGEKLTYEQVKQKVENENPDLVALANGQGVNGGDAESQLAMIDPSQQAGQVLGASIGTDILPASEFFSQDKLEQVEVKKLGYVNQQAVEKYADQISSAENNYDALSLLGNFSSSDTSALKNNAVQTGNIIGAFNTIAVPQGLEEYHRYKVIYYVILQSLAQIKSGEAPDDNLPNLSSLLFSVMDKINALKADAQNKYQVSLP